jgi:hypothetical protein
MECHAFMKNIFLITSAIHTKFGVIPDETRFYQTVETIESIRRVDQEAYVVICDASMERDVNDQERAELLRYCDDIISLSDKIELRSIYENTDNWDVVKNYSEMVMCIMMYGYMEECGLTRKYDRIFKLSGRYRLSENFNIRTYDDVNLKDKVIFSKRKWSQFPPSITGGLIQQYMCRLYSFPTDRTIFVTHKFKRMLDVFVSNLEKNIYTDLEHSMFREFSDDKGTHELEKIGVIGQLGPNGCQVED